jgi:uncharacterized membrane protein
LTRYGFDRQLAGAIAYRHDVVQKSQGWDVYGFAIILITYINILLALPEIAKITIVSLIYVCECM